MIEIILPILIIIVLFFFALIFRTIFNSPEAKGSHSPEAKGSRGEKKVSWMLDTCRTSEHEYLLDNIILYNPNNQRSSQIDHIFICGSGVIVVETKNYSGFIFGTDQQKEWTQVLAGGKSKQKFYSPVKQNATHIYLIKSIIGQHIPVFGKVIFIQGNTENIDSKHVCTVYELRDYINDLKLNHSVLTAQQQDQIYCKLCEHQKQFPITETNHLENIQQMKINIADNICPRCGAHLVLRNGKYGKFYGCTNYPHCKFTKHLE